MTDARVYIATTQGPALVQRLAPEEGLAEAALSAVCLDGTTTRLPITGAYTYFVRDHIRELSGVDAYRLDLDHRVDGGASWMLGAWVAHLLLAENRLAMRDDDAETTIFATGEVAFAAGADRRAEVRPVAHVAEKMERLAGRLNEETAADRRVLLLVPGSNMAEAEAVLDGLTARERVTLYGVSETGEIPALLESGFTPPAFAAAGANPPKRRRGGLLAIALLLCILALAGGAGYSAWRSAERGWDELLHAGRYLELGRSLDGFALPPVAAFYRKRLRERLPVAQTPEMVVTARRPADGGSCAGLRFRGGGMKDIPLKAADGAYRVEGLRSLCGFTVGLAGGEGGHVWLSLELLSGEGVRAELLPARRMVSGALTRKGLRLFQNMPLYFENSWSWRAEAVWAPVRSEDVERLLERDGGLDDETLRARLGGFGVSLARTRITLGSEAGEGAPDPAPRIESFR